MKGICKQKLKVQLQLQVFTPANFSCYLGAGPWHMVGRHEDYLIPEGEERVHKGEELFLNACFL